MEQNVLDCSSDDGSKPEDTLIMKIAKLITLLLVLYAIIFY